MELANTFIHPLCLIDKATDLYLLSNGSGLCLDTNEQEINTLNFK